MSWLSSLTSQFNQESDSEESEVEDLSRKLHHQQLQNPSSDGDRDGDSGGGGGGGVKVKEKLSEEIRKSIGRQLRGVASFLAPPPQSQSPSSTTATTATTDSPSASSTTVTTAARTTDPGSPKSLVGGIKSDFAEIGGSLKSGLSLLSSTKAVSGISRFATTLLRLPEEDEEEGLVAAGVNQQVLEFVRIMSSRPECWTEFPLPLHQYNDFNMSQAQKDHALTVEELAPSLEDLRYKLCPGFMSEDRFWMIYFIMLYPRLSESDAMLLATPKIVEVRKVLLQNLQNKTAAAAQGSTSNVDDGEGSNKDEQDNTDQWLEEEDVETGTSLASLKQFGNDEDVSFSDLEDDDNDASTSPTGKAQNAQECPPRNSHDWVELSENSDSTSPRRRARNAHDGSPGNSNDWVQLSENSDNGSASRSRGAHSTSRGKYSEGEESNDWSNIESDY